MNLKHIAHNISDATIQPRTLLPHIRPYQKGQTDADNRYGVIHGRKNNSIGIPVHTGCIVRISPELRADLDQCYFPGGYSVHFYQQANTDWLVSFDANDILASKYMRLKNEDVMALAREGLAAEDPQWKAVIARV